MLFTLGSATTYEAVHLLIGKSSFFFSFFFFLSVFFLFLIILSEEVCSLEQLDNTQYLRPKQRMPDVDTLLSAW